MLALEVEFLTGRCVATQRDNRSAAEWPPHPSRLFSALAAAFFECDFGTEERDALEWLERQGAPTVSIPRSSCRSSVAAFVPVNDSNDAYIKRKKTTIFPKIDEGIEIRRNRQERFFPTLVPEEPRIVYCWQQEMPDQIVRYRPALERLVANVTYVGHSSSLVRVAVCDTAPPPTLVPVDRTDEADVVMRVPGPRRLKVLQDAYEQSLRINRRVEPPEGIFQPYARTDDKGYLPLAGSLFDDRLIVFRFRDGRRLPLHAVLSLTTVVRKALISVADEPGRGVPEAISGHRPDRSASQNPHLAIIPLANVGSRYSDGAILGFALVLPHRLADPSRADERRATLLAIAKLTDDPEKPLEERGVIWLGRMGVWRIERVTEESRYKTLQPERYTRPSRYWASITPVVFGKFPKRLDSDEARQLVCEHCRMIGLPEPRRVEIVPVSPILGVHPSAYFPTLSTQGKPVWTLFEKGRHRLPSPLPSEPQPRLRSHVLIEFEQPVRGPVLLGAGRYLGMGYCLPVRGWKVREE